MTELRPLLTQKDVCSTLRTSSTTLWRLARKGELCPVYLTDGGPPRYRIEDVETFVERRAARAANRRSRVAIDPERPRSGEAKG